VTVSTWSAVTPALSAPSASALRSAFALYFADEALSSVRHDILNRLTAIGAITYELRNLAGQGEGEGEGEEEGPAQGRRERIADLNRQIGLMSQTVSRRLGPGRDPASCTSLSLAIDAAIAASVNPPAVRRGPLVEVAVRGSTTEVAVMLLALLDNAFEAQSAAEPGGAAETAVVDLRCWLDDNSDLRIEVGDRGPGLGDEARERAFERFFTTKPGHAGLGLGMTLTLATRLGGQLQLQDRSAPDEGVMGACATLVLPLVDEEGG
jgi:signal transduction histidine kinase